MVLKNVSANSAVAVFHCIHYLSEAIFHADLFLVMFLLHILILHILGLAYDISIAKSFRKTYQPNPPLRKRAVLHIVLKGG